MFQDIRQPRRSLKEVLPGRQVSVSRPKKIKVEEPRERAEEPREPELKVTDYSSFSEPRRPNGSRLFLFLIIAVVLIGAVVVLSGFLSSARVIVVPKTADLVFDKAIVNYAPVESMIFTPISESVALVATGQEKVSEKATGQVVIYNNFSSAPQKLVATTRLESKAGKVYRLVEAVTVPGQKTVSGKVVPGSVEAKIIADVAGDDYNSPLADFTIPGFKGGPRYDKFYARSKTPLTGGLIGTRPIVAEADKTKALESLHSSLVQKLLIQSRNQIPEGFILYDSAANFEFADKLLAGSGTSSRATLTTTINGSAYLFEEVRLATELLKSQPQSNLNDLSVVLPNIRNFNVVITVVNQATTTKDRVLKLTVTGKTKAIAQVDTVKLISALIGKTKPEAASIFNQVAEIQSAKVGFSPFWLRRFPEDPAKVKIQLEPNSQSGLTP